MSITQAQLDEVLADKTGVSAAISQVTTVNQFWGSENPDPANDQTGRLYIHMNQDPEPDRDDWGCQNILIDFLNAYGPDNQIGDEDDPIWAGVNTPEELLPFLAKYNVTLDTLEIFEDRHMLSEEDSETYVYKPMRILFGLQP